MSLNAAAIAKIADMTSAMMIILRNANALSQAVARAQAEGRQLTQAEWDAAEQMDNAARAELDAAQPPPPGG